MTDAAEVLALLLSETHVDTTEEFFERVGSAMRRGLHGENERRERIALAILAGRTANGASDDETFEASARFAVIQADALMQELDFGEIKP